jgi:hypothetical protein
VYQLDYDGYLLGWRWQEEVVVVVKVRGWRVGKEELKL